MEWGKKSGREIMNLKDRRRTRAGGRADGLCTREEMRIMGKVVMTMVAAVVENVACDEDGD